MIHAYQFIRDARRGHYAQISEQEGNVIGWSVVDIGALESDITLRQSL